jgi:GT2 family glycosyltransferase/glycosyltransferase involved in cell wall biosynthesis
MASSGAQPPPLRGPSMRAFWDSVLKPLIEALEPERILEIGSDQGTTTRALLERARSHGAVVHAIDPKPSFDPVELEAEFPGLLVFHRALSLEVLPRLERFDLALIDGDHNWHTVLNELRLLERQALEEKAPPPLVALHDVGWPYGRRDLYYDPDNIPADKRQSHERRAIHPDSDELVDEGINAHLANAKLPAARHSGVHGAIDDFLAESEQGWKLFEVPGQHGLGILAVEQLLAGRGDVRKLLKATASARFLRAQIESVERARIDSEIRRRKANRGAEKARAELAREREDSAQAARKLSEAGARLDEAEREVKRLARRRDLAEKREGEVEDQLIRERRRARLAEEESEAGAERRKASSARISELEGELARARAEATAGAEGHRAAEARAAALAGKLEQEANARRRLVADFEDERASLERGLDDARAQADTGYHAAAELREMLEVRELETQRLVAQLADLQAALGRARADADVARAERSALDRRLGELAALHESTLAELGGARPTTEDRAESKAAAAYSELELEALERFTAAYRPSAPAGTDPLALPSPHDRRGALRPADSVPEPDHPSVDVVVCVHDALEDVRRCLWSLVHKASYPFRLIVVNDGSGTETTAYLRGAAAVNPEMTLIDNASPPHGYAIAANLGMREAGGDYVVVLNSDTVVTSGWLEKIVACGESDERIGILGPLSNAASHQSVPELRDKGGWATNPLPAFVTADGVARLLERVSPCSRPRLPFINGFCYVVKRAVFEAIGYFDEENFASGYCEENDFSYRAAQAGFELAVSDDCYVFHAKSKSFTAEARAPLAKRNYGIFLRKHGPEKIESLVRDLEEDTSLEPLRAAIGEGLSSPAALATALNAATHDPLDVAFILPGLGAGGSGGSHSIYQEVRGLRALGVPARILLPERAWQRAADTYADADEVFETFADLDQLSAKTAGADVISATHFKSAAMLAQLRRHRQDFLPAYYVQDYEPFFAPGDSEDAREAIRSYDAISDCLLFAKTHWLCNIVGERHGLHLAKVEPSIDEELFRPGDGRRADGPLRLAAMIRPRTPRRQPAATIGVLEALRRDLGEEVEVVTFGCDENEIAGLAASGELLANHRGLLTRQGVAALLGRCDVFLDMSMYQAFGRTALEAMACGCTAVVPRLGGVWEFVEDGVNAHAVDTLTPTGAIEVVSDLARDRDRLRRLQSAALRTAAGYSIGRAALSEYLVFSAEHARRFGTDRAAA